MEQGLPIKKITKKLENGITESTYYRPLYGAITQDQINFLAKKNIKTVLWSKSCMDWDTTQNKEGEMFEKFKKNIHNGAVVLLHDFDFGNINAKLKDLEKMLEYGKSLGFSFVKIEDII